MCTRAGAGAGARPRTRSRRDETAAMGSSWTGAPRLAGARVPGAYSPAMSPLLPLLFVLFAAQDPQNTPPQAPAKPPATRTEDIEAAARVIGLELSESELKMMPRTLDDQRAGYAAVRAVPLLNSDPLCFAF